MAGAMMVTAVVGAGPRRWAANKAIDLSPQTRVTLTAMPIPSGEVIASVRCQQADGFWQEKSERPCWSLPRTLAARVKRRPTVGATMEARIDQRAAAHAKNAVDLTRLQ